MTHTLARMPNGRSGLALVQNNDDIKVLDIRTGDRTEGGKRVDTIATISLGFKNDRGFPVATQEKHDRWLHPHDAEDAPALIAALEAGHYRRLTISFPSDDWGGIVQDHFAGYTQSRLQVFGDEKSLTWITKEPVMIEAVDESTGEVTEQQARDKDGKPAFKPLYITVWKKDEPEKYAKMLAFTKVQTDIFFYLAAWTPTPEGGWSPDVVMDGDVGLYRLRTTSSHTVENLKSTVKQIRGMTGNYIKGVPLTLSVAFPEVAGPDGHKRKVSVCTFRLQPPFKITGVNITPMLAATVTLGQTLALPAPAQERLEDELRSEPLVPDSISNIDDREIDLVTRGGRCPVGRYTRIFFSMTRGTELEGDDARARTVSAYTNGRTGSLAELLHWSTDEEARAFIAYVDEQLNGPDDPERPSMPANEYERLYEPAYRDDTSPLTTPPPSIRQRQQVQPDGSLVDTASGEIIDPPQADQDAPISSAGDVIEGDQPDAHDAEIAEASVRLQAVASDLDELIAQAADAPVEPTDDEQAEPLDYQRCLEIYQAHSELTLDKPLARQSADWYRHWHDEKFVPALEKAGNLPF